ncbi:unnamed protein product [Clonostachys chloroleuca]|uniref:Uncharacterized protein n=1 Tax=Clonostachys chloroleuca TaxID=1926264 RepID=A0AA35Q596_9HYPO|nr:unnamed protein product [Clonostachys chloroleuca]
MAPIPVYSSSPINAAAKASGITPRTAGGDHHSAEAPETTTSAARPQGYPVAQPGAQPTLPAAAVQTGAVAPPQTSAAAAAGLEPTPTHQLVRDGSPPAPQPGAVPVALGTRSKIPPPPRAGESLQAAQLPPTAVPSQTMLPPQMSYPAPNPTYPPRAGSSTITAQVARSASGPVPTPLGELGPGDGDSDRFSHPPGYHQNALGPGLSSRQEDQGIYTSQQQRFDDDQDEEGLWGAARKWATAAGNSLAQAENEVWKRINKG